MPGFWNRDKAGGNGDRANRGPSDSFSPLDRPEFERFASKGAFPQVLSFRIASVNNSAAVFDLPNGSRVELWVDCKPFGAIEYLHLAVLFDSAGEIRAIAAAEVLSGVHDKCFLGLFADGRHTNLGTNDQAQDREEFLSTSVALFHDIA